MTTKGALIIGGAAVGAIGGLSAWLATRAASRAASRMLRPTASLNGKTVFITGGSRGLGLQLAREFANEGCRVAICARDAQELERAREDLSREGGSVYTVTCDITQRD